MSLVWEEFVAQFGERIYRYCHHMLGSAAEAEDATQDVFVKCFEKAEELSKADSLTAWVYTLARNRCIDRLRWYKRALSYLESRPVAISPPPGTELQMTLRTMIAKLPSQQREVFILRHWHGFSTDETAQLLKVHTGTVKTQLKRAVDKLKGALLEGEAALSLKSTKMPLETSLPLDE
jgi:RNA polymerase sigma-70 factor (ECF subfamily)